MAPLFYKYKARISYTEAVCQRLMLAAHQSTLISNDNYPVYEMQMLFF